MSDTIKRLTIEGFKSIRKLEDFELRSLNVLIGANGAGKSNFVEFFRLLREMIDQRLQTFVNTTGGADAYLYLGPKVTGQIAAKLRFGNNGYDFRLVPTEDNSLIFADEATVYFDPAGTFPKALGSGHPEAKLKDRKDDPGKWGAATGYHTMFTTRFQAGSCITFTTPAPRQAFAVSARSTTTSFFAPRREPRCVSIPC